MPARVRNAASRPAPQGKGKGGAAEEHATAFNWARHLLAISQGDTSWAAICGKLKLGSIVNEVDKLPIWKYHTHGYSVSAADDAGRHVALVLSLIHI